MTAQQTEEIVYNEFAEPLSDIIEQFGFEHLDTVDYVETWELRKSHGSTTVAIDYISGVVTTDKFNSRDRHLGKQTVALKTYTDIETAARTTL